MKTLQTIALALLALFAPTKSVVITVMALTMVDFFTGIIAAKRSGTPITSNGFKRTILKILVYETATLCAFVVGLYLTGPELPVMNLVTSLIGLTELKSVLENLDRIVGGSFFRSLTNKLQNMLNKDN